MKCQELFNTIEKLNDEYINVLKDVCCIESSTEYKEGVDRVGKYFADRARKKDGLLKFRNKKFQEMLYA